MTQITIGSLGSQTRAGSLPLGRTTGNYTTSNTVRFLKPVFIGELFRFCKEELGLESCSVVNNGSKVTEKWLDEYGGYLDVMALSCDSFDAETNRLLGRSEKGSASQHARRIFEVAEWCRARGIIVKINTVITRQLLH